MRGYVLSANFSIQPPAMALIEMDIVIQSTLTGEALVVTCEVNDPNWIINEEGLLTYASDNSTEERTKYTILSSARDKETNQTRIITEIEKEILLDFIFSYCKEEVIEVRSQQEEKMMLLFGMDEDDLDLLSENERKFLNEDYKK